MDFTEGFKRYLYFEASFPLSFFFFSYLVLGLWEKVFIFLAPLKLIFLWKYFLPPRKTWVCPRTDLYSGQDREGRGERKLESRGTGVRAANTVQGVRDDGELEVTLQVTDTEGSLPK